MTRGLLLYRTILREHRRRLPPAMRDLGDRYVRDEFRKHRDAKDDFLPAFFAEWDNYVDTLRLQSPQTGFGAPLQVDRHGELNDEQKS